MGRKKRIQIATDEEVKRYSSSEATEQAEQESVDRPSAETPGDESPATETVEADDLARLREECETWKDKFLRAKADMANMQRRAGAERTEAIRFANADLMRSLLPILDDLERTLEASGAAETVASVADGVRLIYDNMIKILQDSGVQAIGAAGEPFDPSVHQAVMQKPSADCPDKTVLQELQRGYRLHDRLLRPAKVIVSQASATDQPDQNAHRETPDEATGSTDPAD